MQVCVQDSTGKWAQALTEEQFKVVHDHIVTCMNSGKRIKDEDLLAMLSKADKPISFLSSVLMDVALYEQQPIFPMLGGWLGSDVPQNQEVYNMARECLSVAEHSEFDMGTDEETQRTFLFMVATAHGAVMVPDRLLRPR